MRSIRLFLCVPGALCALLALTFTACTRDRSPAPAASSTPSAAEPTATASATTTATAVPTAPATTPAASAVSAAPAFVLAPGDTVVAGEDACKTDADCTIGTTGQSCCTNPCGGYVASVARQAKHDAERAERCSKRTGPCPPPAPCPVQTSRIVAAVCDHGRCAAVNRPMPH